MTSERPSKDDWDYELNGGTITFKEPFILSAKEALVKTKETHLKAIESYILAAIEKGQTYCEIMPSQQFISQENQQILKDAGYTVTEKESMAGKEIKISWQ
jgi:hypothetical protein